MNETDGGSLIELGAAVRELNAALVATIVPGDRAREVAARVREMTGLLTGSLRDPAKESSLDELDRGVRFFSPVSGPGNPTSPPLSFDWEGDDVVAKVSLDARYGGPPGYVHGGVIALIFDEALAQPAIRAQRRGMTAYLNVSYHSATPLNRPLLFRSRATSATGRKTFTSGELVLEAEPEVVLASAEALFVTPRAETANRYFDASVTSLRQNPS